MNILSKLSHVNIVKIFDAKEIAGQNNDVSIYMVTEYCNQGDLENLIINNRGRFSEHEILNYFL